MKCRQPSQTTVQRWIDEGFGQGEKSQYKSMWLLRDKTSQAPSRTVYSRITEREHDYVGELPWEVHMLASYRNDVYDIREEYAALPWEETQQIARSLNVRHPCWSKTGVPKLLTTSVVLSLRGKSGIETVAISVTSTKVLNSTRAREEYATLKILSHYWRMRAIRHLIVDENNLPRTRAQNLGFFWHGVVNAAGDTAPISIEEFVDGLSELWAPDLAKGDLVILASDRFGITSEVGESLLGRAVWQRKINIDLDRCVDYRLPLPLVR